MQSATMNQFWNYDWSLCGLPAHLVRHSLPFPPPADDFADCTWRLVRYQWIKRKALIWWVLWWFRENMTFTLCDCCRLCGAIVKNILTHIGLRNWWKKSVIPPHNPIVKHELRWILFEWSYCSHKPEELLAI